MLFHSYSVIQWEKHFPSEDALDFHFFCCLDLSMCHSPPKTLLQPFATEPLLVGCFQMSPVEAVQLFINTYIKLSKRSG